jgi:hypothetical protein
MRCTVILLHYALCEKEVPEEGGDEEVGAV